MELKRVYHFFGKSRIGTSYHEYRIEDSLPSDDSDYEGGVKKREATTNNEEEDSLPSDDSDYEGGVKKRDS